MESQSRVSTRRTHDVIVIGGGSAGYAATRNACDTGADVAIVDQGPPGRLCILHGCMPTKAILRSAEVAALLRQEGALYWRDAGVREVARGVSDR